VSWHRQLALASATLVLLGLPPTAVAAAPVQVTQFRSGLTELDRGWLEHEGRNGPARNSMTADGIPWTWAIWALLNRVGTGTGAGFTLDQITERCDC